jgi:hypothetical protein
MPIDEKVVEVAIAQVKGFFYPSEAERAAAYELLIELTTRPSGAPSVSVDASISDELRSIAEMFELTRGILRTHGTDVSKGSAGNISLAVVALRVLNEVFRPVLDRWRPLLDEHMSLRPTGDGGLTEIEWERRWERAQSCRSELVSMRSATRSYIETLSQIAGTSAIADAILSTPSSAMLTPTTIDTNLHPEATRGRVQPRLRMVRWYHPIDLYQSWRSISRGKASVASATGRRAVLTTDEAGHLVPTASFDAAPDTDFWFDYVVDMGDAFDGTAPIAWLVGRRSIHLPDHSALEIPTPPASMPHADLVVFGGDELYPFASEQAYLSHTELPYRMGVEGDPGETQPTLVAIPGNHDWLGGIEHFERMFVSHRPFAEHWKTVQDNNWFHVKLPQGWWIWGIDTALDNELIGPQAEYFRDAAESLRPGDRVILCTPVPLWQLRQKYPAAYAHLRNVFDPLISAREATMPLCLSGDTHCFAHLERVDIDGVEDHIMAGGGGAFLQPTHNLPERIPLEHGPAEFKLTSRWPLPADSRSIARSAKRWIDPQFWMLMIIAGGLQLALAGVNRITFGRMKYWIDVPLAQVSKPSAEKCDAVAETCRIAAKGADQLSWPQIMWWTLTSPWVLALLILISALGVIAFRGNSLEPKLTKAARVYGVTAGLVLAATLVVVNTTRLDVAPLRTWWTLLLSAVIGGIVGISAFMAVVRWSNTRIKANDTMAFNPAQSTRYKHFVRFRIGRNGDLTAYVVGIDPVGVGWYEAMTPAEGVTSSVPPYDPAGSPRLHYVWGKTYPKFVPTPLDVAISISDPDEYADSTGTRRMSASNAFEELAPALVDRGHTVLFGGAPGRALTERLIEIDRRRHADNPNATSHVVNFVADHLWSDVTEPGVRRVRGRRGQIADQSPVEQVIADLTAMRRQMTEQADIRVVIGGALRPGDPGTRLAPGVIEEAFLALDAGTPLLIAGGFGGAAALMADALTGRLDRRAADELATHFVAPNRQIDPTANVSFLEMLQRFSSVGILRNGLTDGENVELLRSSDPDTVTSLILRSIHRIGGSSHS